MRSVHSSKCPDAIEFEMESQTKEEGRRWEELTWSTGFLAAVPMLTARRDASMRESTGGPVVACVAPRARLLDTAARPLDGGAFTLG